jgi:phage-related tail fiber protein
MANLPEPPEWADGVYQIETPDPVLGGPDGIANKAARALASRTVWLKAKFEGLVDGSIAAFKATRLAAARKLSVSGAATGSATFDGSADANISLTLADSGVAAGTYQKVTVSLKGLVTGGGALAASDIPGLDWGKIVSGKPTTLAGYGITDALGINGTAVAAKKLETPRTISTSGAASGSASFDGSANVNLALTLADSGIAAGTYTKIAINAKGLATSGGGLAAADIPGLDWSKITSGKPNSLAGYGIVDSYTQTQTNWVVSNAFANFSAPNIQVPAFINGFADRNVSRFWKANGNVYVTIDASRWVSNGAGALVMFTLPPGFRPLIRMCGTGDWATSSPFALGWLSWRVEASGEVVLDYATGSTAGAGGFECQLSFCVQAV